MRRGLRPTLGLVVADLLEPLHERVAPAVEGVVQLHVGQRRVRGPLQHGIAGVADGVGQTFALAEVVDGRHAEAVVRPHPDDHVGPGGAEPSDQAGQDFHGPATGVDRPRPQPGRQGEAADAVQHEQREVLVLLEVAVVARQRLSAVRRVVAGVDVQDDLGRRRAAGCG